MTSKHPAEQFVEYDPELHPRLAFMLARVGLSEEGIARRFKVPDYTLFLWEGAFPALSEAMERGRVHAALQPPQRPSRYRYPAYTYALHFFQRAKRSDLAQILKAKMDRMKAISPAAAAAFNDALWERFKRVQPGRKIPQRT